MDPNRDDRCNIDPDTLIEGQKYKFQYGKNKEKTITDAIFMERRSRQPNELFSLIFWTKDSRTPIQYYFSNIYNLQRSTKILDYLHNREIGQCGGIKNGLSISKRKTGRKSIKKINKKRKSNRTFRKRSK